MSRRIVALLVVSCWTLALAQHAAALEARAHTPGLSEALPQDHLWVQPSGSSRDRLRVAGGCTWQGPAHGSVASLDVSRLGDDARRRLRRCSDHVAIAARRLFRHTTTPSSDGDPPA